MADFRLCIFYHITTTTTKKEATSWPVLERSTYWKHDEDKNARWGWKPDDWLQVHLSGLTLKMNLMSISDRSLQMHLWSGWTRDPGIRNTSQLNATQMPYWKKRESYVKMILNRMTQKAWKNKTELTDWLPDVSNHADGYFRFVRELYIIRRKIHKILNLKLFGQTT